MREVYFEVSFLSDVVLNSKLATEGNMKTLDYIPGSNFLGIVAGKLYNKINPELAFEIFHSGKVKFGDGTISLNNHLSYSMPYMLFMDKLNNDISEDDVFVDCKLDKRNPPTGINGKALQLKQQRGGYVLSNGEVVNEIEKTFAIKSAQDRKTRTSKDGSMFGFESLIKGTRFIFSVQFDDDTLFKVLSESIVGEHRLGKSRSAEYGQIEIRKAKNVPDEINSFSDENYTLVYAKSNLCFVDPNGLPTFQPSVAQLGFNETAEIDWSKSQIRVHTYSPWNFKRNSSNSQRDCITKGSVIYVKGAKPNCNKGNIGLYQSEGLGNVIYNPEFLMSDERGKSTFVFRSAKENYYNGVKTPSHPTTFLSNYLNIKLQNNKIEKESSEAVMKLVYSNEKTIRSLKRITSSQWGGIRALATKTEDIYELSNKLFGRKNLNDPIATRNDDFGYLTHGVADKKYWGKNRGANRAAFEKIFSDHIKYGSQFIAKFAAEMAKESRKMNSENN